MGALKNKVLLVGSQHGDELLGIRLHEYIAALKPDLLPNVDYYCANPLAFACNKRFIDSDMNRSYGENTIGYETEQANQLSSLVQSGIYTYIIDCHTTTTEVGICFIVGQRNDTVNAIINAGSGIDVVVAMRHDIASLSLLAAGTNVVAVEVNETFSTEKPILQLLLDMVEHLVLGEDRPAKPRYIYHIDDFIKPNELKIEKNDELKNFVAHEGKYPVLYGGDKARRTYSGFWATDMKEESI